MQPRFFRIPIGLIDPPVANPRFEAQDLEQLAESIKGVGILEPLVCVAVGDDRVRLVAGLRRYSAAKLIGLTDVPALVHARMTDREELAVSLVENLHRKDMTPVERGAAFVKLHDAGLAYREIARMVGLSLMTVGIAVSIATKLIPEAREACHAGELTQTEAWELSKLPESLQRAMFLGERGDMIKVVPKRGRSKAETALRAALTAIRLGDRLGALDLTRQAVEALEQTLGADGADGADAEAELVSA